jgi:hypothetical protein
MRQAVEKRTEHLQAFDAVLRCHHYFTVLTEGAWRNAYEALERAVELDPTTRWRTLCWLTCWAHTT